MIIGFRVTTIIRDSLFEFFYEDGLLVVDCNNAFDSLFAELEVLVVVTADAAFRVAGLGLGGCDGGRRERAPAVWTKQASHPGQLADARTEVDIILALFNLNIVQVYLIFNTCLSGPCAQVAVLGLNEARIYEQPQQGLWVA